MAKLKDHSSGAHFQQPDKGSHIANLIKIIDLGVQYKAENQFGAAAMKWQIMANFEFPNEIIEEGDFEGQPLTAAKWINITAGENGHLFKLALAILGPKFTVEKLEETEDKDMESFFRSMVGKPCTITVGRTNSGKTKILDIAQLAKGVPTPEVLGEKEVCMFGDSVEYDKLSDGIQAMVDKGKSPLEDDSWILPDEDINASVSEQGEAPF